MSSKAARRRSRKKARTASQMAMAAVAPLNPQVATYDPSQPARGHAIRPTDERLAKGTWAEPSGAAKSQQPIVDLAHDMVGRLHVARKITDAQEQAARSYQELRQRFAAELPDVTGYKSCLAGGNGGHDGGDGNPAILRDMRELERRVGILGSSELYRVCVSGDRPGNLDILRRALDDVAG